MEEIAYVVNEKDSPWEHFFLSLEEEKTCNWKIQFLDNHKWKTSDFRDNPRNNYQNLRYFKQENEYNLFLKKRFIVNGREDLFRENKKCNFLIRDDFATASIVYVLKFVQDKKIKRFRGQRIKEFYERITHY